MSERVEGAGAAGASVEIDYIRGLRDAATMVDDAWEQGLGLNAAARAIRRHAQGCEDLITRPASEKGSDHA